MKKILFTLMASAAIVGLSSCKETWDDNPKLEGHTGTQTANFLNAPALQNQSIMLTEANQTGNFHLTCSQPEYGYAAVVTYKVQCSLTEDFKDYREISQSFYDCAEINPLNSDVAAALEYLNDVKTEDDLPLPYQRLYMRLRAYIEQSPENTEYLSNVVYFNSVAADYLAIWVSDQPVNIYLRGGLPDAENWDAIEMYQFRTGASENTWYLNDVYIPGGIEFKVADAQWGAINLGAGASDTISPNELFPLTDNGGNIKIADEFRGNIHLTLSGSTYTLVLEPAN